MNDVAISVRRLGKSYRIYHNVNPSQRQTLYRDLGKILRRTVSLARGEAHKESEIFWALKDVTFDVKVGEVLGLIGRNGAGKSTLLKIFSQITDPTEGEAHIYGRVGSLLEVGTGFNVELTGRENIFLNGTILGMSRREIQRRFDVIVDFAGIEQFIDTPVKHYSSGMYVRLGFAVAAHLESEILIVDEVLSVGDAEFQKKCLGKMQEVAGSGRTVLFVSHNMASIQALCDRAILLEKGQILENGDVNTVIEHYLLNDSDESSRDLSDLSLHGGPGNYGRNLSISLHNDRGDKSSTFSMGETVSVELEIECLKRLSVPEVGISVLSSMGIHLHQFISTWEGFVQSLTPGRWKYVIKFPVILYPGRYMITTWLKRPLEKLDDQVQQAIVFKVMEADVNGYQPRFSRYGKSGCEVYVASQWDLREQSTHEANVLQHESQ